MHPLPIAGFAAMQALSTRNDEPERASRPYDTGRDGFVLGEGAAVIVLESEEHARARGAQDLCRARRARHVRRRPPHRRPRARGRRRVARHGRGRPDRRAHRRATSSTSTPTPRRRRSATSPSPTPSVGPSATRPTAMCVSATKSMTGHLLGAAGALEGVLTILSVHHRIAPRDDQPRQPRPRDPARRRPRGARAPSPTATSRRSNNSFGFGGHNVALAITSI